MNLSFNTLRSANRQRLPGFKNSLGQPAHSKPDGSDWSPAQWLQAVFGELGEMARVRIDYEEGRITETQYRDLIGKEAADVVAYMDLFAQRCLDTTEHQRVKSGHRSHAQALMHIIASLGEYANTRKKYDRDDYDVHQYGKFAEKQLADANNWLTALTGFPARVSHNDVVNHADEDGIDLGAATATKFNEVTRRVKSNVFICNGDGDAPPSYTMIVRVAKDENERGRLAYNTDPTTIHPCYD